MSGAPSPAPAESPFNGRTVFGGLLASLLAAAGFVLLSTYAPDFRVGHQGASPVSRGGAGFAGVVELMTQLDDEPETASSIDDLYYWSGLVVVTIAPNSDPEVLKEIVETRSGSATLFVLPKWRTVPFVDREGWEREIGRLSADEVDQWLARLMEARVGRDAVDVERLQVRDEAFAAPSPRNLQWAAADNPLVSAGGNRGVLIQVPDEPFYVLTDPDLIANNALRDPARAAAAIGLVEMVRPDDMPVMFDLTLHGANRKHDLMKLLLEPPFLALTLSILAAAMLAVLHGLGRFGPPETEARAISFGKRALVDTTARLMRRAGRLDNLGGRYAALMRRRAGAILGAPHGLRDDALDRWLEARDRDNRKHDEDYAALSGATRRAGNEAEMTTAARKLHRWIARRFRERR